MGWEERLERFVISKVSRYRMPSLAIAVTGRDRTIYSRAFGFADVEKGVPASPATIYGVGSITKSFTALSIMRLAEEGRLSVEDPVSRHLPIDLKVRGVEVTIHHLLTHSSGVPAMAYAEALIRGYIEATRDWLPLTDPRDVLVFMREADGWSVARPGERFYYLNEGYVLLGMIIESASGYAYPDYVRRHILDPLGMESSFFIGERDDEAVATPYVVDRDSRIIRSRAPKGILADGGLMSSVLDLSRYLRMLINRGRLGDTRIVDESSIEEMEKPHIPVPWQLFGGEGYGYGLIVYPNFLGRKLVGHSGSLLVYTGFIGYVAEEGLGVAVLSNSTGYPTINIGVYALSLAMGEDPEGLEVFKRERILESLEGSYRGFNGNIRFEVKRSGDFLILSYRDKYASLETPLIPERLEEDYSSFYTLQYGRKMKAEFYRENGRIVLLYERYKLVKE